jgi:hypothetical protein
MSDLRLQNLLQSMRQNVVISKDNLKLSAVNITVQPPQFPDVIQNFLNAQIEILQAKQSFDLKNAVLAQLRIVDVSTDQKDKVDIQLAFKGEVFTISLKTSEVPKDVLGHIHSGRRLALSVVVDDTTKPQYNLILIMSRPKHPFRSRPWLKAKKLRCRSILRRCVMMILHIW